jgi:hypothetical protein
MLPAGSIVGAPEDGRNYRPKHELIEIINKIIIVASSWLFILLLVNKLGNHQLKEVCDFVIGRVLCDISVSVV